MAPLKLRNRFLLQRPHRFLTRLNRTGESTLVKWLYGRASSRIARMIHEWFTYDSHLIPMSWVNNSENVFTHCFLFHKSYCRESTWSNGIRWYIQWSVRTESHEPVTNWRIRRKERNYAHTLCVLTGLGERRNWMISMQAHRMQCAPECWPVFLVCILRLCTQSVLLVCALSLCSWSMLSVHALSLCSVHTAMGHCAVCRPCLKFRNSAEFANAWPFF